MKAFALLLCLPLISSPLVQETGGPDPRVVERETLLMELATRQQANEELDLQYNGELQELNHVRTRRAAAAEDYERRLILSSQGGGEEGMREGLARVVAKLEDVMYEREVLRATRNAIEKHTVGLVQQIAERLAKDELLESMEAALDAQEDGLSEYQGQVDVRYRINVAEASLRIIEARMALADRRATLTDRAGGQLLDSLRGRLVEIDIEIEVHEVRQEWLRNRVEQRQELVQELMTRRAEKQAQLVELGSMEDELADRVQTLRVRRSTVNAQLRDLKTRIDVLEQVTR